MRALIAVAVVATLLSLEVSAAEPVLFEIAVTDPGGIVVELHSASAVVHAQLSTMGETAHAEIDAYAFDDRSLGSRSLTIQQTGWGAELGAGPLRNRAVELATPGLTYPSPDLVLTNGECMDGCYIVLWTAGHVAEARFRIESNDPATTVQVHEDALPAFLIEGQDMISDVYFEARASSARVGLQSGGRHAFSVEGKGIGVVLAFGPLGRTTLETSTQILDCTCFFGESPLTAGDYVIRRDAVNAADVPFFAAFVDAGR